MEEGNKETGAVMVARTWVQVALMVCNLKV